MAAKKWVKTLGASNHRNALEFAENNSLLTVFIYKVRSVSGTWEWRGLIRIGTDFTVERPSIGPRSAGYFNNLRQAKREMEKDFWLWHEELVKYPLQTQD